MNFFVTKFTDVFGECILFYLDVLFKSVVVAPHVMHPQACVFCPQFLRVP